MAINKRKILQSAQKHMQKGALEKALKDYMALLKADPKDANLRLKVGDIHLKQGKTEDAVAAYRKVADQFMNDGFDAKAVAIFKQVTKIDPKRFDIYLPLSELYQRMGLTSEAMRALQTAADGAYREGDKDQALDLLRKMAALDPSNTTNRLKVAELLIQEERNEEAVTEFAEVASELERQGDAEEQLRVLERMLEVGSVGRDEKLGVGQVALTVRRFDLAIEIGQALTDLDPGDADAYELLGSGYDGAGQVEQRTAIYTKLAEIYRERGDDDLARDVIQRFGGDSVFGSGTSEDPVLAGSEDPVEIGSDDPELSDPGFTTGDGLVIGEPISDLADAAEVEEAPEEASASGLPPLPEIDEPEADASPAVDPDAAVGDPEQLLAEASVYLRYGKRERALESLRSILSSAPEHPDALAKLIEAIDDPSDPEQADAQARLDALQGASPAVEPEEAPALETDAEFDIEIDDDLDDEITLDDETGAPVDAEPVEAAPVEVEAADAADEIEIDLDAGSEDVLFDADADPVMLEPADGGLDADDADALGANADEAIALDSDAADAAVADLAGDDDVEIDLDDTPIESAGAAEAVSLDAADAAPLGAEDEIDFEFDDPTDGDDGDAAADVEAGAADEVELGDEDDAFEIDLDAEADEAPLAADPAEEAGLESGGDEVGIEIDLDAESVELSPDAEVAAELDIASEPELDAEDEDDTDEAIAANLSSERRSASLTTPAQVVEDLEEADFYFEQGMFTEAREIYERIVAGAPNHPQALLRLGEIDAAEGGAPGEAPAVPDVAAQAPEDAGVAADRAGDEIEVGDPMDLDEAADDAVPIDASNEAADEVGLDASALGFDGADASGEADVPEIGDIGEIEELDDEAIPEEDTSPTDAAVAVESIDPVLGDDPETLDAAAAERTPLRPTDAEAEITAPALDEDLEDGLDDDTLEGITPPSESEALDDAASADAVDVPEDAEPVADEPAPTAADVAPVADEAPAVEPLAAAADSGGDDLFDLAAELSDALDGEAEPRGGSSTEEEGFEQVFAAFKQGVQDELDDGDHEAHYDLGIAYKEMGLLEDAIGEFRAALSPDRQLACLHMMALCSLDLGRAADAVANLEQALSVGEVPSDQGIALRFDLGRAYAVQGDVDRARAAFEAVREVDPSFCDVETHLAELDAPAGDDADDDDGDGEAFESFDDLIAAADDTQEPVAAEPEYESFDDLMGEDDDEADAADDEPEAAEPDAEASEPPEDGAADAGEPVAADENDAASETPTRKPRKKKKISFV